MEETSIPGAGDTVTDGGQLVVNGIQHRRRGNGGILTLPSMPRAFLHTPSQEETIIEGESLFYSFLSEEITREIPDYQGYLNTYSNNAAEVPPSPLLRSLSSTGSSGSAISEMASELLAIADEFRQSEERRRVMRISERLPLEMNKERFFNLLCTIFEDGITKERFIVVFFFCRDIAIRALRRHAFNYFKLFLLWSVEFIKERVCTWVQENGGWARVLSDSLTYVYRLLKVGCVITIFVAAFIYVYKSVKSG